MFLPARTPRAIVDKLAETVRKTMEQPALRERFAGLDVTPMPMTPPEFDALVRRGHRRQRRARQGGGPQTELARHNRNLRRNGHETTDHAGCGDRRCAGGTAAAQDKYPSKPIKIVVPYAPGGATDITSRLFGEQLKNILGQQVVVENKAGAFGILGIEEMARAKPDGYTLFIGNVSTNAITPVLFKSKFQVNFEKDVISVSRLAIYPSFLITTTAGLDVKSVKELVDHAKKNPGKVRFTSAGVGSLPAFRHGGVRAPCRRRHGAHSEQDRRGRHDQRSGGRRRTGCDARMRRARRR